METPRYFFNDDNRKVALDFPHLGFDYIRCPYRFEAVYEHGVWRSRGLVENNQMCLPEGSQCLHYGQQLFEGMKVQTGADGKVYAFRPGENARRLNDGARYLKGAPLPEELFIHGVEEVTRGNLPYVPPYGSGAALYVRPFWLGVDDNVGVKPASSYIFRIFVTPVGPYFKGGFGPDQGKSFRTSAYDRAAPKGTGHVKAGGNYAASFIGGKEAKSAGYAEALYLDPAEKKYIEEIGAANFLALKGETLITPESHSILPSITRRSIMTIAAELFDWPTENRKITLNELDEIDAAACCGTAAVITWVKEIVGEDKRWEFPFDKRWQQLYDKLTGIQTASEEDPFGWRHEITT
ncbi:MAG: branched-chain amino acid aminotransferase [Candidatus Coatesbacteria bacterium]|nr:branched-chain amino acid aminotransferase [Candidatus Coatesbacteria bacterium]